MAATSGGGSCAPPSLRGRVLGLTTVPANEKGVPGSRREGVATGAVGVIAGGGISAAKAEAGVVPPGRSASGLGVFRAPGVMGAPFPLGACWTPPAPPPSERRWRLPRAR